MLILNRKANESIIIGDNVEILLEFIEKLDKDGITYFTMRGQHHPVSYIAAGTKEKTHHYLRGLVTDLESEYASLEARITEILTFNPNLLSENVNETKIKLDEVDNLIKNNELLVPMTKPIKDIRRHFESVSVVASNYEDIYKNIIKPVQEEGRSGVQQTVKWAIISIVVSTLISLVLNNWDKF